jgi:hypothetical protein
MAKRTRARGSSQFKRATRCINKASSSFIAKLQVEHKERSR